MIKTESVSVSSSDLELINKWTLEPLTAEQVYTFSAKLIDAETTLNNRQWSVDWQKANVEKFNGAPVTINHDTTDASLVMGRIFHAEQVGNAINGKIFIPLTSETGKTAAEKIKNGQLKSMSINAKSDNSRREGEVDVILPSHTDRILEVSFVAVGGCQTCGVQSETASECQKQTTTEGEKSGNENYVLKEFAVAQLKDLRAEFVRLAAFTLGTGIDRKTYQSVAESVSPLTLRQLVEDFKKAQPKTEKQETGNNADQAIKTQIENLRNFMGV